VLDKIVIVTQKTRLDELRERFNTRAQAQFYIEHMGLDFGDYAREDAVYREAVAEVLRGLESLPAKLQRIDRELLSTFLFTQRELVVVIGRDGLVVNAAKYLDGNPILAVNPDPARWDGVLLPFAPREVRAAAAAALAGGAACDEITMAEVALNDGQRLLAFNDFLVGRRTHASARYQLRWGERSEEQSSSGVLISTGAGCTGWLSSARNMAQAVSGLLLGRETALPSPALAWHDPRLMFVVREPFLSRSSGASLVAGFIEAGQRLCLESHMPEGGVIFSDGVESDALAFNSGAVAEIGSARRRAQLLRGSAPRPQPQPQRPQRSARQRRPGGGHPARGA
jgi:NAD kinase